MNKLCTRAALLVLVAGALASCGGADLNAKAPSGPAGGDKDGDVATTPEAALAQLDVAERNVARALGYRTPDTLAAQASAAPAAEPPPPPPPSPPPPADAPRAY